MIKRIYVDNFKCLVNFEYRPAALELLFGGNGTGKSTVFEILERLREFVAWRQPTDAMFPIATLTAWQSRPEQRFELEIEGNGGHYSYAVVIEQNRFENKNRVKLEELRFNGKPLYLFDGENAHLFRDDSSAGPVFPQDWSRSGVSSIPERPDNQLLCWFRRRLNRVHFLAIEPNRMVEASIQDNPAPNLSLDNFASWYRHLTQDAPETMGPLFESLGEVIDGFAGLRLSSEGETARILRVSFKDRDQHESTGKDFLLTLSQLSTGQRCLIALFTILHCAVRSDTTICIDEPDNFVALRELQPWLTELCACVEDKSSQCLLISHHPEFIDLLAVRHGARFTREGLGPVRIKPFEWSEADGIRPSESVARGWED